MHSRVYISGRRGSPGGSPGGVPLNGVLQTSSKNLKGGCWMHFCVSFLHSMDDIQLRCATQVAVSFARLRVRTENNWSFVKVPEKSFEQRSQKESGPFLNYAGGRPPRMVPPSCRVKKKPRFLFKMLFQRPLEHLDKTPMIFSPHLPAHNGRICSQRWGLKSTRDNLSIHG